ncbi:MAG: hypothetical protein JKY37_00685 [Nannocystaceae bacterium]|nr:hypothetical protein [Nannocystaceae bacterium]
MKQIAILLALSAMTGCGDDDGSPAGLTGATGSGTSETSSAVDSNETGAGATDTSAPRADLGVDPPQVCQTFCATVSTCLGSSETDCLLICTGETEARVQVGSDCIQSFEAARTCAAALSCSEIAEYQTGTGDYPCGSEDTTSALTCSLGGEDPPAICTSFCDHAQTCGGENSGCLSSCLQARWIATQTGKACGDAQDAVLGCALELECEAFAAWLDGDTQGACHPENESLDRACGGDDS